MTKTALRAQLRRLRRRLAAEVPDAAERVVARLGQDSLPAFASFAGYVAMGSELDPSLLMRQLARHARAALPAAASRATPFVFRAWDLAEALRPDAFGIPSPGPSAPIIQPDLIIAPLLGFDRRGGRLGQGSGLYDRTLAELRREKRVFVLGLAYSGQELGEAPMDPHDQRLDAILTETEFIRVATDRG